MSPALALLAEFQALSPAMWQAAEDQSWEVLEQLLAEREALQARLPEPLVAALPPEEQAQASTLMQACLALDQQTRALAGARQQLIRCFVTGA